jgi:hypothetical protein
LTEGVLNDLCDFFVQNAGRPIFPEPALCFLQNLRLKTSSRQAGLISDALLGAFQAKQFVPAARGLASETISLFIPAKLNEWQEQAYKWILSNKEIDLALQLLLKFSSEIDSTKAQLWFSAVIRIEPPNDKLFLVLCLKLLGRIALRKQEFLQFLSLTKPLLEVFPEEVCQCYATIKEASFSDGMLDVLCSVDRIDNSVLKLVSQILRRRPSSVNKLCDMLFRVNDERIIRILTTFLRESNEMESVLPLLLSNLENEGSLSAICALIHEFEDGIDKGELEPPSLHFVHPEDLIHMHLAGEFTVHIRIPKFLDFEVLRERIAMRLKCQKSAISIDSADKVLFNGMNLVLRIHQPRRLPLVERQRPSKSLTEKRTEFILMLDRPDFGRRSGLRDAGPAIHVLCHSTRKAARWRSSPPDYCTLWDAFFFREGAINCGRTDDAAARTASERRRPTTL